MSGFPQRNEGLSAPLELPATTSGHLTTQGGNTLDDGAGNVTVPGTATLTVGAATGWEVTAVNGGIISSFEGSAQGGFGNVTVPHFHGDGISCFFDTAAGGIIYLRPSGNSSLATIVDATGNLSCAGHINATPTTPALPANPPVSGTVYQNTTGGPIIVVIPITATAIGGSAQLALGATSSPSDWGGAEQIGVSGETHNVTLLVPNGWYWSVTVTNATIGTASVLGQ